ncbi:hypothetical protein T552_03446 [Pneumocystis carinii B80]|uniref:Uncharacterized protein n=1 Tax=Pneumocystis carinii (strain B80) TaxID=1408658 RepID=A0A0W4ZBB6_PNEC8|nr:hypothetical protein T552_03446 [Pneumocystis carinii B80]KTW25585.1 hypothetical protein T552_03446 [Pneumocystis carinii B80]
MSGSVIAVGLILGLISWLAYKRSLDESQRVGRVVLILSLVVCYLIWAITYLAQLHPLLAPQKAS